MNLLHKTKHLHFFFLFLLATHYILPLFLVGEVVVNAHDNLDSNAVYDHIISKIYRGDLASVSYFLSENIKWYYLESLFYPINILHYILSDKLFYFTNDIIEKLFAYFSFFLLAKSLGISRFNSALGGALYATFVFTRMPLGFGMAFLPYILYLLLNKDKLDKKHYFFLFFIGLNSSLIHDALGIVSLVPLAFLLRNKSKNLNIYIQVFSVILIALILSNIHLVIGAAFGEAVHREAMSNIKHYGIVESLLEVFIFNFFEFNLQNPLFFFYIPSSFLSIILVLASPFSKVKKIKLLFFFIIFILFISSILGSNLLNNFYVGVFDILKGFNFRKIERVIPLAYTLLFIYFIMNINNKNIKKFLYFLSFILIFFMQMKIPLPELSQYFLKNYMHEEKFVKTKEVFIEKKYTQFANILFDRNSYTENSNYFNKKLIKTFDNYYKYNDYAFIKKIVKNSKVMSVGLDPMVAVMNDIQVIDGYHNIYPLQYKIKFRKIIEKEIENNIILEEYYDKWGSRVYAYYNDQNNLKLNFKQAKKLGANYIISKFPIKNSELLIICNRCNNSDQIFLYRIL